MRILWVLVLLLVGVACQNSKVPLSNGEPNDQGSNPPVGGCKPSIEQGVYGKVIWKAGNFMPTIGQEPPSGETRPAQRKLLFYKALSAEKCLGHGPLFDEVRGELVATAQSNKEGCYEVALEPGRYSVFSVETERSGKQYANIQGANGQLNPVVVQEGKATPFRLTINYEAVY